MSDVEQLTVDWWNGHPAGTDTITVTQYEEITARCDRCGGCFWSGPLFDRTDVAKAYTLHRHDGCLS